MGPNYRLFEALKMITLCLAVGLAVTSAFLQMQDGSQDSVVRARMIAAETP